MAQNTTHMRQWFEGIRDERVTHANTATRIGQAFLMLLNYLLDPDTPFLRKDQEDQTNYLLRLVAGAYIGESGQIRLNPDGSITCQRINVLGSAIFNELVFNHQNVLEGDTFFTDKGIIEEVEYLGDGQYRLTMRKEYENDQITFHAYDVLRCAMNNLDVGRTYKTSWMRVDSVDLNANTMNVTLYDGEDVPGGVNYAPEPAARLIRWGNQADSSRQQVFFISSVDGSFLFLQGVTQPIVDDTNYSAFVGLPPDLECLRNLPINTRQAYMFARGLIVQDIIKIYVDQTDYGKQIQMNYPNLYAFMCDRMNTENYYLLKGFAVLLTLTVLAAGMFLILRKRVDLSDNKKLLMTGIWSVFTCLMFLSSMHERYAYLLDILLLIYFFSTRRHPFTAVIALMISLRGYCFYLFGDYEVISLGMTSIVNIGLYVWISYLFIKEVLLDQEVRFLQKTASE